MAIEFLCKTCETTLRVPEEHAGKQARCPKCQTLNLIQAGIIQPGGEFPIAKPIKGTQTKSSFSNPYEASNVAPGKGGVAGSSYLTPHRGSMVLTFGILAVVCNFFLIPGILAWIMGRQDIKDIDAGRMDPQGRGLAQAGMILGIIFTILPLVLGLFYILLIGASFIFFAAAG